MKEAAKQSTEQLIDHNEAQIAALEKQVAQLKEECGLNEKLNDASIDRIMAFDTSLRVIAWNRTSELITGIPSEEVIGENLFKVFPELKNCKENLTAIENALKGYKVFVPAPKSPHEGGYYENHYIPLKEDDKVTGVLNIKHDVAHRIKTENELKSLNKALVKKNKELKQRSADLASFTHIASHDLKEPVRKIYTFSELILNKEGTNLSEAGRKYFKRIQVSAQRMGMLTDDILTYSQLNAEEQSWQDVDLNLAMELAKDNIAEQIAKIGAIIQSEVLPSVKGYRNMLVQLFQHLISNAIKFQPPGNIPEVTIAGQEIPGRNLKHVDAQPDAMYLAVSIKDNGIGFDKKYSDKVFQMFQRLHNAEAYPGTGMGLALCKKIAEMHQGFISVESKVGEGSSFTIFLQLGS